MKKNIWVVFMLASAIVLFGTLGWAMVTPNPMPFILGYPIAAILLGVSYIFKPKRQ